MEISQILEKIKENGVAYILLEDEHPLLSQMESLVFASSKDLCENFIVKHNLKKNVRPLEIPLGDNGLLTLGVYTSKGVPNVYLIDAEASISKNNLFLCREEKITDWTQKLSEYSNSEDAIYFPILQDGIKLDFDNNYMGYTKNMYFKNWDTTDNHSAYSLSIVEIWGENIEFDDSEVFNIDGEEVSLLELRMAASDVIYDRRITDEKTLEEIADSGLKMIAIKPEGCDNFLFAKNEILCFYNDDAVIRDRMNRIKKDFENQVEVVVLDVGSTMPKFIDSLRAFNVVRENDEGYLVFPPGFMLNNTQCVLMEDFVRVMDKRK